MSGAPVLQNSMCFRTSFWVSLPILSYEVRLTDDNGKITEAGRIICASPNKWSLGSFNKILNKL